MLEHWEYMKKAYSMSEYSIDPKKKVGAVIVDKIGYVMAVGFNKFCDKIPKSELYTKQKNLYMIHAEMDALLNSQHRDLTDYSIYVTLYPCYECAKHIVNAGISKVYYDEDKFDPISEEIFKKAKVLVKKIERLSDKLDKGEK